MASPQHHSDATIHYRPRTWYGRLAEKVDPRRYSKKKFDVIDVVDFLPIPEPAKFALRVAHHLDPEAFGDESSGHQRIGTPRHVYVPPPAHVSQQIGRAPVPRQFCSHCGVKVNPTAAFCYGCGSSTDR